MDNLTVLREKLNYNKTFDCVQCGYCLPVCPTYETMQIETHSPRGRINLVKMVAEGKMAVNDLDIPIDKCLGCMACVTACPTGVDYGAILDGAKEVITEAKEKSAAVQKAEDFLFKSFFPSKKWMDRLGNALWLYQRSGAQKLAQNLKITQLAPMHLNTFEAVLPQQPRPKQRKNRARHVLPSQPKQAKVAFFTGCVMDSSFFQINEQTIDILKIAGAEVILPEQQTCCGALHAHAGKGKDARALAKENIIAFENEAVDYIVNNAGGCGAKLVQYDLLFAGDPIWEKRAKAFSSKVKDISEVLVALDSLSFTKPIKQKVTYQPSCHMTNVQKVISPPKALMEQIPDIYLQEMDNQDRCCGSAGIYNIVHHEDAMDILELKMKDVEKVAANIIVTTNPGCLLQMKIGVEKAGLKNEIAVYHLVELLMQANPVRK